MAHHHEKFQSFSSPGLNATSFCYLDCTSTTCTLLCNPPLGPFFPPPFPPPPPPPPPPCSPPPISVEKLAETHHLSPIVIVIVAVLTSAFLLISYYAIVKKYFSSNRRSNNPSGGGGPAAPILTNNNTHGDLDQTPNPLDLIWYVRTVGLDESVIKSITVCKYKRGEGLVEGTECSVCLNEFHEDEDLRLLPKCSHAFHVPCIDTWLKSHVNCPLCRANVVANTMISPVNDPSLVSSDLVQEPQEVNSQNHIELGVNMSNGAVGNQGLGDVDRAELGDLGSARVNSGFRAQSDLIDNRRFGDCTIEMMDDDVQQVRRSVSMDSLASAIIAISMANLTSVDSEGSSTAIGAHSTGAKNSNLGESSDLKRIISKHVWNQGLLKAVGNYSKRSFLQKGPILMKRSFSGGGKFFLARNGRSRNAVLPL